MSGKPEALFEHLHRTPPRALLLAGEEGWGIDHAMTLLRHHWTGQEAEWVRLVGSSCDAKTLATQLPQPSLFARQSVVVIEDAHQIKGDGAGVIAALLAEQRASLSLVLVSRERVDPKFKNGKLFKAVAQHGVVALFYPLDRPQRMQWLIHRLDEADLEMTQDAKELLIDYCHDLPLLAQELDKLTLWGSGGVIREEHVEAVAVNDQTGGFQEMEAAFYQRDPAQALRQLRRLRAAGIEPPQILFRLASNLRLIVQGHALAQAGQHPEQIAKTLRVFWKQQRTFAGGMRRWSRDRAIAALATLSEVDRGVKTGEPDRGLERWIARFFADRPTQSPIRPKV